MAGGGCVCVSVAAVVAWACAVGVAASVAWVWGWLVAALVAWVCRRVLCVCVWFAASRGVGVVVGVLCLWVACVRVWVVCVRGVVCVGSLVGVVGAGPPSFFYPFVVPKTCDQARRTIHIPKEDPQNNHHAGRLQVWSVLAGGRKNHTNELVKHV